MRVASVGLSEVANSVFEAWPLRQTVKLVRESWAAKSAREAGW